MKELSFACIQELDNLFIVLGAENKGKANLSVIISNELIKNKGLNASEIIRTIAKEIDGGGGGQAFFATAGGKNPQGLKSALEQAKSLCG